METTTKYLGSIRLARIDSDFRKTEFWRKARASLAALNLHPNLQRSIEDKISERIPIPEEMRRAERYRAPRGFEEKMKLMFKRLKGRR